MSGEIDSVRYSGVPNTLFGTEVELYPAIEIRGKSRYF